MYQVLHCFSEDKLHYKENKEFALIELKLEEKKRCSQLQSQMSGSTDSYVGDLCIFGKTASNIQGGEPHDVNTKKMSSHDSSRNRNQNKMRNNNNIIQRISLKKGLKKQISFKRKNLNIQTENLSSETSSKDNQYDYNQDLILPNQQLDLKYDLDQT